MLLGRSHLPNMINNKFKKFLKVSGTVMRYFAKMNFSGGLVHEKDLCLI